MSQVIPTTSQLNTNIISQLEGALGQTIPLLPKSFARVLARVLAGVFVLLYRYCGFIFLQMFVAHATMEETTVNGKKIRPLVELGRLFGVGDPQDATRAELNITVTVTNQTGNLQAGQKLLRAETGVLYDVVATVPLNASTITAKIRASGDGNGTGGVGDIGNLQPGDVVSFAKTPANIGTDAVVLAQVVTAADAETTEHYRARILARVQRRPQGGAYADYREWSEEVPGILNAYPYAGEDVGGSGPGQVDVYIEATAESAGNPDGIPTTPQLDAVFANIQLNGTTGKATRRPVGAAVNVLAISRTAFDLEISGLQPDTSETRSNIQEAVEDHLASREPFIEGLSVLPRDDRVTKAALGGIVNSVTDAQGATVTTVELLIGGVPTPAYTLDHGRKAKLGSINYV